MRVMTAAADKDQRKREAARRALDFVKPGMKLGLGSGTTAHAFVDVVGEAVKGGLEIVCVGTSKATEDQARSLGIPLSTLDDIAELDLVVDGADEIDPQLRLIKGGGGALLREKIVAAASKRMAVIADSSKLVPIARRLSVARRGRSLRPCCDPAPHRERDRPAQSRRADPPARRVRAVRHRRGTLYP